MRVAIFARVSTKDGRQNNARQVDDLKGLCESKGWEVVEVITENISGATANDDRPELQKLFKLAQARTIQKVIITEVSRLGRKVSDGIKVIDMMTEAGVSVYIQNIGMETLLSDGKPNFMFKPILLTLIGFSEMERELLRERIKSGLNAARKAGKRLGRPLGKDSKDVILAKYPQLVKEIKKGQLSVRKLAKVCDVSPSTVQKVKAII